MDLAKEIRDFLYDQGQLAEGCTAGDGCRHIVDHPIWSPAGYVADFTCYNAAAFAAALAHHLEQRHKQDEEMAKALANAQHSAHQAWLDSPAGREAFRQHLAQGVAILRSDVTIEHLDQEGQIVRVIGSDGKVIYEGRVAEKVDLTGAHTVTLEPWQP